MAHWLLLLLPSMAAAVDVIVVGAGVSGLTAARTLLDNWAGSGRSDPLNIFVLEASNRLGGRTFTNKDISGWTPITGAEADWGASWIHGSNPATHPVTKMAKILNLQTLPTKNSLMKTTRCNADASFCSFDVEDNFTVYSNLVKQAQEYASPRSTDMSMWDAMTAISPKSRDDPAVQMAIGNTLEFEYGASPDNMSAWNYNDDKKMKGGGPEELIVKGYSQIAEALQAGALTFDAPCIPNVNPSFKAGAKDTVVDVRLNKKVTDISVDPATNRVLVKTADASSYLADRVIVTVPLGVLKKKSITFTPPLLTEKQTGIDKLWFGDLVKVGLLFDTAWWKDTTTHYYGLAMDNAGGIDGLRKAEKFTYFLNTLAVGSGRNVLFTFAFGASAMEVESWTDDQVWDAVYKNLVATFKGAEGVVVPAAKPAMWRSNWGTNELFGGVYASNAPGATKQDWKNVQKPMTYGAGALSFAGEHTNHAYRGTVHGAFWSGQRAACETLWPNGKMSVSSVAILLTPNPSAALLNAGFAAAVDGGVAAAAGVAASSVTVQLSLTPPTTPVAARRLQTTNATNRTNSTNRTLYVQLFVNVQPGQAANVTSTVNAISSTALAASIKQQQSLTNGTDDDIDFEVEDIENATAEEDIEDSDDETATTGTVTATTTKPKTTTPGKGTSSDADIRSLSFISVMFLTLIARS